jgi:3-oxoacyl-[acyl-carrier protein] reductase
MSDFFLELGQKPYARKVVKALGLPVPMPQPLRRARSPWEERPLSGRVVAVGVGPEPALSEPIAHATGGAGASLKVAASGEALAEYARSEAGEVQVLGPRASDDLTVDALVFDASGVESVSDLRGLYEFFHPLARALAPSGRAVVVGRPPDEALGGEQAAARAALEGFVRSLGREIGRRGATANVVYTDDDADERLPGVLRFLLSDRAAFVSGQPFRVTAQAVTTGPLAHARSLAGKVALVTGAARGIGEATAEKLAAEGAKVVCLDRPADAELAEAVAKRVGGSSLLVDVRDPEAPARIARVLSDEHGGVDIVVHNAGITRDKTLARMAPPAWDEVMDINLSAPVAITRALVDEGVLRDGGRVICLSSVAGIAGNMGQTNYAAAKAGLIGLVRGEASALAARGITVNAVAPGFIETRLTAAIPVVIREVGRRLSNLGQGGEPRDVADVITFLATPASAGLTGSVVRVCGGAFIGA